jgi:dipeptidase D
MSNDEIIKQQPTLVWKHFAGLSTIPRVSYHEEKISQWLFDTIKNMGFTPESDKLMNVFARVPASKGYEHLPVVLLQGHMDMVGAKRPGSNHDFLKDPIQLIKDGD